MNTYFLKLHGHRESIAYSWRGQDTFVAIVAVGENFANGRKMDSQIAIAHVDVWPDSRGQFFAWDNPVGVLNEDNQDCESSAAQTYGQALPKQDVPVGHQFKRTELIGVRHSEWMARDLIVARSD